MKVSNRNILSYTCLALGLLGIIGQLSIFLPVVYDHYRDVNLLNNAITDNVKNNNEQLAQVNSQLLESKNRTFNSTIMSGIILVAIPLGLTISGIVMLSSMKKNKEQSSIA